MQKSIFVGGDELNEAYRRVGMIVGACARLEHALAYLEWQLTAYSWDAEHQTSSPAERQTALRAERQEWDKYATLECRLKFVTKAFEKGAVSGRISKEERLKELRRHWEILRERARELGKKRNEIGHTYLSWHLGQQVVVREVGRPWGEQSPVSEAEDNSIVKSISNLGIEIGRFTTELGTLLPFADDDQFITA